MKHLTYEHRNAGKMIPADLQAEVIAALAAATKDARKATPCRDALLRALRTIYGWCDEAKLTAGAKISITSLKDEVGLCVQTGNMGRFYADILKLEYLFNKEIIKAAIYIIPEKALANEWGENIANFERFTKELGIFSSIIHVPIYVIAIRDL